MSAATTFLFAFFREGGTTGLYLAESTDGYQWNALHNDAPLIAPQIGTEKLMRDPFLLYETDGGAGGRFHLLWTVGWRDPRIGYASSPDLLSWSEQRLIPVMAHEPTARNAWAPEALYDPAQGHYIIFWSTTIPGRFPQSEGATDADTNHRIFCTTTTDFETFTPTTLYFDPGYNCIDASLWTDGAQVRMVFKDERLTPLLRKNLRHAVAPSPLGPFTDISETFSDNWMEGPTILKVGDAWLVYADAYKQHRYLAFHTTDWITLTDVSERLHLPPLAKHGTALTVPTTALSALRTP